ncbi:MAG: hypothetical protein II286_00655, partial [Clostridia bacterium]|nr:hypothetical protein [Clostridia bacterium]
MLLLKKILKRTLSVVLTLCIMLSVFAVGILPASAEGYDPSAALAYAKAHWNDGKGLCAEFVRDCLRAGGLTTLTSINCGGLL